MRGSTENWEEAVTKLRVEMSLTNKFLIKSGIIFLNAILMLMLSGISNSKGIRYM